MLRGRKQRFLKKARKNFYLFWTERVKLPMAQINKKFFGSFFQKRTACLIT
jgi:hypothetical protein